MLRPAVQLYTLRSSLEKDLEGTLKKLRETGLRFVELAGTYGLSPAEFQKRLDNAGLIAVSTHIGANEALDNPDQAIEIAKTFGYKFVIVPWLDAKDYAKGWAKVAHRFNDVLGKYHEAGLHLGYHNHAFEFTPAPDGSTFKEFWETASDDLIAEFDLFWLKMGGQNPAEWIRKFPGQVSHLHFKDHKDGKDTEVGSGDLNWDDIIKACKVSKTQYAIIEHDNPTIDPVESVRQSLEFLKSKGLNP